LEKIRIIIASGRMDDLRAVSSTLGKHDDFLVSGEADDDFGLVKSAMRLRPDVIVADLRLGDSDALALAPVIRRNSPATSLVVLYRDGERLAAGEALGAGVSGYLPWRDLDLLAPSIRCVFFGGMYVNEPARRQMLGVFRLGNGAESGRALAAIGLAGQARFTATELQIFRGLALGGTDREIAEFLHLRAGSVRNCIWRAKKKAGMRNRIQLGIYALYNGLITLESDPRAGFRSRTPGPSPEPPRPSPRGRGKRP
jgi:DNA-binding NarL/FixJ family response regulator